MFTPLLISLLVFLSAKADPTLITLSFTSTAKTLTTVPPLASYDPAQLRNFSACTATDLSTVDGSLCQVNIGVAGSNCSNLMTPWVNDLYFRSEAIRLFDFGFQNLIPTEGLNVDGIRLTQFKSGFVYESEDATYDDLIAIKIYDTNTTLIHPDGTLSLDLGYHPVLQGMRFRYS